MLSFFLPLCFFSAVSSTKAQSADQQLIKLRDQLAMRYFDPAAHMDLAKYFWSRGDRLQAFYLCENARRSRFPEMIFDGAFAKAFGGSSFFDNSDQAEALFEKGAELQKIGRLAEAEQTFVKAAELASNSAHVQMWTGRFFYKVKKNEQKALKYYLNAYFLDPHAYETEYVEYRIRGINMAAAAARYRQIVASGISMAKISTETNPTVVVLAAAEMGKRWKAFYVKTAVELMSHDDEEVRWLAMEAIRNNVNASFDPTLDLLLQDTDFRRRGMAAYIAAFRRKKESLPILQNMLSEKSQLLRFDALSALAMFGGEEGLQILIRHRAFEPHPTLKELIDKSMNSPAQ